MNDTTINTEVTMRDTAPAGGAKRFRPGDEILGRYVVEAELGQGGMGVVYLCLDKVAGVKVAVKGLPPEVSHNSDEMESVRENFQLVSELQHPNIAGVRTLEVDAATGNYYLIMAYARGASLKHWLRQHGGKKHRTEQLKVLRQIALALDYAHNAEPRHIIHRDIKPENIMVDERGNVSVLDFGLAAQVRSSLSRVSQLVTSRSGTPAYKSPEQWLAQPQRASSDQYALGVIAYQMYSGELPYDSDDVEILKHAVAFDPVPEIPEEGKDVNAVFAKVLAKKANERFPSCAAFVDALEGKRTSESAAAIRHEDAGSSAAEQLRKKTSAILDVERLFSEVARFEEDCKEPAVHLSLISIKSAQTEMSAATPSRCLELLEAVKVFHADAKSAYDEYVSKAHLKDEVSQYISAIRRNRDVSDDSEIKGYLRDAEQLRERIEKAASDGFKSLQEKFTSIRERADNVTKQILERRREQERKRKLEEEERRKQEAVQREQALVERKRREEQEKAERKRKEDAELVSLVSSIDSLKQEIKNEHEGVSAYLNAHPEYLDSRQVAAGLKGLVYEETPKDLQGARKFHERLETALLKLKGMIASLDLVVCATVDGAEVDGATMLYGTRTLNLPVRIKRKQRLSENDGYQLKYSCFGQEYVGWFSPANVRQEDRQCAMVPLRKIPKLSVLTKIFIKRDCIKYLLILFNTLIVTTVSSAIAALFVYEGLRSEFFASACFGVSAIIDFYLLYRKLIRRDAGRILSGRDAYWMQAHSAFNESELLLDRKRQAASKRSEIGLLQDVGIFFKSLAYVPFMCVSVGWVAGQLTNSVSGAMNCAAISVILTIVISYRKLLRKAQWDALINKDKYSDNAIKLAKIKAAGATPAQTTSRAKNAELTRRKKSGAFWKWLLYVAGILLLACGVCVLIFWLLDGFAEGPTAETSRPRKETLRSEVERERKESARVQSLKAETERLAIEKRKAEAERVAAEEAARKARKEAERVAAQRRKAEAERIAEENRKAEEARLALERAEAERKAKEDAERAVLEASQRAIELFKKGDWQSGLKQAEKANQDDAELLFWLGTCYDIGLGANCDAGKAVGYFRRAAEKGQVDAQCELGHRYEMGQGVTKDLAQAKRWYQTAASQGSKAAETSLRRVYDLENASARETSLARERAQKEREEAARKAREAEEAEKVRKLQEELAQLKETAKSVREEPAIRTVPTSDRTRRKFDGTPTMTLLKFSSKRARNYYEKAAESAREGAHNKAKVRADYEKGRACGGPAWPELEAWLEWWK